MNRQPTSSGAAALRTLWISSVVALLATSQAAALTFQFLPNVDKVKAKNVTPKGEVLFLSACYEKQDWTRKLTSRLDFVTANKRGIAVKTNASVADASIWAAVDLKTGSFSASSPSGQYEASNPSQSELFEGSAFTYAGERLDLVVIRGEHAWHARVHDGGVGDGSSTEDGQVEIAFASLAHVHPVGPFEVLYDSPKEGDLLVGIDADRMTYFTVILKDDK